MASLLLFWRANAHVHFVRSVSVEDQSTTLADYIILPEVPYDLLYQYDANQFERLTM